MNLVNGKPSSSISIFDRGFLYGDSVFESILVIKKQPKNLTLHVNRLKKGCSLLEIKNLDYNLLERHIKKSLSNVRDCVLSINVTRGTSKKRGYDINIGVKPNIILTTSKIPKYPKEYYKAGIKTKFSKIKLSDNSNLSNIKHSNRLEQILSTKEITKNCPEIILCDSKDNIVEGSSSNIFFTRKNIFYTPLLQNNGVEGVMKSLIIKILKKNKYSVKRKKINKNQINNYDGAFFCNSIRLIWNIKSIDNYNYERNVNIENLTNLVNNEIYK